MLQLHPDKFVNEKNPEKDYVANFIFASMTEAFNAFKAQEGMKWARLSFFTYFY